MKTISRFNLFVIAIQFCGGFVYAKPWLVYPKPEEAYQVELDFPKGQTSLSLNKITELTVTIRTPFTQTPPQAISQVTFDARMPEHNHGMMTKPELKKIKDNVYRIRGIKLHMEGFWEFIFVISTVEGRSHKISVPYQFEIVHLDEK